jgi:hypothetical protein
MWLERNMTNIINPEAQAMQSNAYVKFQNANVSTSLDVVSGSTELAEVSPKSCRTIAKLWHSLRPGCIYLDFNFCILHVAFCIHRQCTNKGRS